MRKVVDYRIISSTDEGAFEDIIKDYLENGWELFGSISTCCDDCNNYLTRELVKYIEVEK